MYEVKANVAKNRLVIRMGGTITLQDSAAMLQALEVELQRLLPNIDMLNDVRELCALPDFAPEVVQRAVSLLREKGVRRIVRVVGKQASVTVALEKTSRVFGFSAALAYSIQEAEKVLDGYTG